MSSLIKQPVAQVICVALLFCLAVTNGRTEPSNNLPELVIDDFKTVVKTPTEWETHDWTNLELASLAVVGTAAIADRPLRDFMCQQSRMDTCPGVAPGAEVKNNFLTTIETLGQAGSLGVMGGFYLAGKANNNEHSVTVAQDLFSASAASAIVNQTFKTLANRSRPRDNQGTGNFQGYTGLNNDSSFPSGHTTEAFTLASVVASHYEDAWVGALSYSMAGIVGIARMYHDAHWASDVVASAFLGAYIGKTVVRHNRSLQQRNVVLLPLLGSDFSGIQLVANF